MFVFFPNGHILPSICVYRYVCVAWEVCVSLELDRIFANINYYIAVFRGRILCEKE